MAKSARDQLLEMAKKNNPEAQKQTSNTENTARDQLLNMAKAAQMGTKAQPWTVQPTNKGQAAQIAQPVRPTVTQNINAQPWKTEQKENVPVLQQPVQQNPYQSYLQQYQQNQQEMQQRQVQSQRASAVSPAMFQQDQALLKQYGTYQNFVQDRKIGEMYKTPEQQRYEQVQAFQKAQAMAPVLQKQQEEQKRQALEEREKRKQNLSESEFARSSAMQTQYGTYENYLSGKMAETTDSKRLQLGNVNSQIEAEKTNLQNQVSSDIELTQRKMQLLQSAGLKGSQDYRQLEEKLMQLQNEQRDILNGKEEQSGWFGNTLIGKTISAGKQWQKETAGTSEGYQRISDLQQQAKQLEAEIAAEEQKEKDAYWNERNKEYKEQRAGLVSEREFKTRSTLREKYGTYENYLNGKVKTEKEEPEEVKLLNEAIGKQKTAIEKKAAAQEAQQQIEKNNARIKSIDDEMQRAKYAEGILQSQIASGDENAVQRYKDMKDRQTTLQEQKDAIQQENEKLAFDAFNLSEEARIAEEEKDRLKERANGGNKVERYLNDAGIMLYDVGTRQATAGFESFNQNVNALGGRALQWVLRDLANSKVLGAVGGQNYRDALNNLADNIQTNPDYTDAQKVQQEYNKIAEMATKDHSAVGKWVLEQLPSAGAMITDMALSGMGGLASAQMIGANAGGIAAATAGTDAISEISSINKGIGKVAGKMTSNLAILGARAGGSAAMEAKEKGATDTQAMIIGLQNGMTEIFSEMLFGGNPVYDADAGLVNDLVAKVTDNKTIMRILDSKAFDFASEGLEEVVAELLEPTFEQLVLEGNIKGATNAAEIGNAFLGGMFLSVLGNVVGAPGDIRNAKTEKVIKNAARVMANSTANVKDERVQAAIKNVQDQLDYGRVPDVESLGELLDAVDQAGGEISTDDVMRAAEDAIELTEERTQNDSEEGGRRKTAKELEKEEEQKNRQKLEEKRKVTEENLEKLRTRMAAGEISERDFNQLFDEVYDSEADMRTAELNMAKESDRAYGEYENLDDDGSERNEGSGAGGQTGSMAAGAAEAEGRTEGGFDTGRTGLEAGNAAEDLSLKARQASAAELQRIVKNAGIQPTSAAALGFKNGLTEKMIYELPKSMYNAQTRTAEAIADAFGCKFRAVVGNIRIANADGSYHTVDGAYDRKTNTIICRADATKREIAQTMLHEGYHALAYKDPTLNERVREEIRKNYTEEEYAKVLDDYIAAARGIYSNLSEEKQKDKAEEELYADAYSGINRAGASADRFSDAAERAVNEANAESMNDQTAAATEKKTGPPEDERDIPFSIEETEDGKKYVRADRQVIFGNDPDSWSEQLEDYINGKIRRGGNITLIGADGDELILTAMSAGKLSSKYKGTETLSDEEFERKVNAAAHIDELVQVSRRGEGKTKDHDDKHGEIASEGWNYRTAYFLDFDGKYYKATISVMQGADGKLIYNVGQMKERSFPAVQKALNGSSGKTGAHAEKTSFEDNVAEQNEEVKALSAEKDNFKEKQFEVIQNSNPADDDYHTWIRSAEEIKTLQETVEDPEWDYDEYDPDWTRDDAKEAIESGKVTVYSSYPIENGTFVTPSRMEAQSYAGRGKIYSKTVKTNNVAWIDPTQGQYAEIDDGMMLSAEEEENSADVVPWEIPEKEAQERGYPVLNGQQVVPMKTWVHAFDVNQATGEAYDNYGLVVGQAEDGLLVRFENKNQKGKDGKNLFRTVKMSLDEVEAVQGAFQQDDAYLNQLLQQEPEEREYEETYEDPREQVEQAEAEPWQPVDMNTAPTKARDFMRRSQRKLENAIAKTLSVPYADKRTTVRDAVQKMTDEFLQTGAISEDTMAEAFNDAYDKGIIEDREFYDENKDLLRELRTRQISISEEDSRDFDDYELFKKRSFGRLNIKKDGSPVDTVYQELRDQYGNLLPGELTHPADQMRKLYEVANSIRIVERNLDNYYGQQADDFRNWAYNDFRANVAEAVQDMRNVDRYMETAKRKEEARKREEEQAIKTIDEAREAYKDLKSSRREMEKVRAKVLLNDADEIELGRLLRREILPEHIDDTQFNKTGIMQVYEAQKAYDAIAKRILQYKRMQKAKKIRLADEHLKTAMEWEDKKSGIAYARETMERNLEDIIPNEEIAKRIISQYITPVHIQEARSTDFKNEYRDRVRALDLSRKVKKGNNLSEAAAVQMLGEAQDNIRVLERSRGRMKLRDGRTWEEWTQIVHNIHEQNPNMDFEKIQNAIDEFGRIYEEIFERMNDVRIRNGYEPINRRSGYFPHFQEEKDGVLERFGIALGINTQVDMLPTAINGITHLFRPGMAYFANAAERIGYDTAYDAVQGFDKYVQGAADVIFQTDNIQNLRALASQIRYRTSDDGIRQQVDEIRQIENRTEEEKDRMIRDVYENGRFTLNNFVNELDEYTNLLANKKSKYDRSIEALLGRNKYRFFKKWESRVGANMIAANFSSAMTNFIPLTQTWSRVGSRDVLEGMFKTLQNIGGKDGFAEMSNFITNRKGSDALVQTTLEKIGNKAGFMMNLIDDFTTESVVRARYLYNRRAGMSEESAIMEADAFAAKVMADRSKGSMPTIFASSNPMFKAFTQFQLEVNNQFSELFKDMPREARKRGAAKAALMFFKYFIGAFIFNDLYELIVGRRAALDPINLINETVGDFTGYEVPNLFKTAGKLLSGEEVSFKTNKETTGKALGNAATNVLEELPFNSLAGLFIEDFDGGRIAAASAVPNITEIVNALTNEDWAKEKRWKEIQDELNKLAYIIPPFAGNQVQKIWKACKALNAGGSFTVDKDGNKQLQYPIFTDNGWETAGAALKMVLFGKSSMPGAQEWVDNGFDTLTAKATTAYLDLVDQGVKQEDAFSFVRELNNARKTDDMTKEDVQKEILRNSDMNDAAKAIAFYGMVASSNEREKMDAMDDAGLGMTEIYKTMMQLGGVKKTEEESKASIQKSIVEDMDLTDGEKAAAYYNMIANSSEKEKMDGMANEGFSQAEIYRIMTTVPSGGKEAEKLQAIKSMGLEEEKQNTLYAQTIDATKRDKIDVLDVFGVRYQDYAEFKMAYEGKYPGESVSQEKAEAIINSMGLSNNAQKAALFQLVAHPNKKKDGSISNPYSETSGLKAWELINDMPD